MSSYPEWPFDHALELARYVHPESKQWLGLDVSAFDLLGQSDGRRQLVEAIYAALQAKNIHYAHEKYHPSAALQPVRTPHEILVSPREGTCLDLSLLFCGLCFGFGLLPIIIVLEGHSIIGVSLRRSLEDWDAYGRPRTLENYCLTDLDRLHDFLQREEYLLIECTGFASSQRLRSIGVTGFPETVDRDADGFLSFARSCQAGKEQLERADRPLRFGLDIVAAQYCGAITPYELPETAFKAGNKPTVTFSTVVHGNVGKQINIDTVNGNVSL